MNLNFNYMKTSLPEILPCCAFIIACMIVSVPAAFGQDHLLLTEVTLAPDSGEFVEIYNPTANSISLDNYYLADNSEYALIATGSTNVINSDFIVQFPTGHNILPNEVIVVAMKGDLFSAYYGVVPDFEIVSQTASIPDMVHINVGNAPTLTNTGEGIILFYWDGVSDLVADVDMVNAGIPTAANQIVSKTGVMVNSSTYLADAGTIPLQMSSPGIGFSTKRILFEGNNEILSGGNGITGHDETSENTLVTWDSAYTAPTPGIVDIITGINSLQSHARISIYPNPTNSHFFVDFTKSASEINISVFNILGETVYNNVLVSASSPLEINLNGIDSGIYFLRIDNGQEKLIKKIAVQ